MPQIRQRAKRAPTVVGGSKSAIEENCTISALFLPHPTVAGSSRPFRDPHFGSQKSLFDHFKSRLVTFGHVHCETSKNLFSCDL